MLKLSLFFFFFLTCSTCNSIPFCDLSSNNLFSSSKDFPEDLVCQWPGIVIENEVSSLLILKTEFVRSNEDTASNNLPSSERFIGGEKKICVCLFILNSRVSGGFVLVCSIKVCVCFFIKSNNSKFFSGYQIFVLPH